MKRVVVVGGGIAGLAAAYELSRGGVAVTVVERDRLGGVIVSRRDSGYLLEGGPDSFLVGPKPWAKELCEELGLGDRLITPRTRRVFVLSDGELHELPEGVFLTVPTKWGPFFSTGLLTLGGKLRAAMDLFLPRGPEVEDESIGSFVRRRFGRQVLEKLAEPIMAGIYVAPADDLSLRATFPRFADLERHHRSLIKALRKMPPPSGNLSPFMSLRGGMTELVDALVRAMPDVTFLTGREVVGLEPGWKVRLDDGVLEADEVVLAVPAHAAARLWPGIPPVRYVSTATVSLAYPKSRELDGSGFVIPRSEKRQILACTWTSSKLEGRAPDDVLLVRCFFKDLEGDLPARAAAELREILGLEGPPLRSWVWTWPDRNPVYEVGHLARMKEFESRLPSGLHLAGSGFHGAGIPDCVRDGRAVARSIVTEGSPPSSP